MTMDTTIKLFEEAEEGSRVLDAQFAAWVNPARPSDWVVPKIQNINGIYRYDCDSDWSVFYEAPHYTTNLQHAVEAVPPEVEYMNFVADPSGTGWELGHYPNGLVSGYRQLGAAVTAGQPALALCLAILRAYRAMSDE